MISFHLLSFLVSQISNAKQRLSQRHFFFLSFASFLFARPKAHKNKQCVTEPLSLLYYFFIGKFTIWNVIKISFSSPSMIVSFSTPRGVLTAFILLSAQLSLVLLAQQHPILILFVNNKIPNFSVQQFFLFSFFFSLFYFLLSSSSFWFDSGAWL